MIALYSFLSTFVKVAYIVWLCPGLSFSSLETGAKRLPEILTLNVFTSEVLLVNVTLTEALSFTFAFATEGEIEYIISLSNADKIPDLFNGDYFASTGRYYDNGYQSSNRPGFYSDNGSHSVRCVYDVWYWGDEKIENPNRFTWGDEPRQ